ncbi:hypothetical protein [Helicobacter pylori]
MDNIQVLTYIKDLAAGKYKLPWEDHMKIKDGSIYGYPTTGGPHRW